MANRAINFNGRIGWGSYVSGLLLYPRRYVTRVPAYIYSAKATSPLLLFSSPPSPPSSLHPHRHQIYSTAHRCCLYKTYRRHFSSLFRKGLATAGVLNRGRLMLPCDPAFGQRSTGEPPALRDTCILDVYMFILTFHFNRMV